jgi:ABC-type sugar transport system permease subunit
MDKIASLKKRHRTETLMDILFISPQFIIYFTLTILPFFIGLPIVLTDRASFLDQTVKFIGLENFRTILQPPVAHEFLPALSRSAVFTVINYSMVYIFGMTLALLMYELTTRVQRGFFVVIYMPYMVSGLGIGMMLIMLFSRDTGSINLLLIKLGILKEAIDIKQPEVARWALPVIIGWKAAGFNMALFLSGLLSIPVDTIDAARVDGTNYFQRLRHIYFPQMIPSIIVATIMCLIGSFGVFDEPMGLGARYGNKSVEFLSIVIYRYGFQEDASIAKGIAMSLTVYLPLFIIAYLFTRLQKKLQY